ncbi:hypothetical protein AGMMS49938_11620 [Fibrobacterales bacterium]|nr:hypothetical protein AGMMS49938_11620 [Fibrobacterales bacterium]
MRVFIFYLFISLTAVVSFAAPISKSQAEKIALNIANSKNFTTNSISKATLSYAGTQDFTSATPEDNPLYYVFNTDKDGFTIISGDDIFTPVVGVAEKGKFDPFDLPPNFAEYLRGIESEMRFALENGQTASAGISAEWAKYSNGTVYEQGTHLIQTTWDQNSPYNDKCPTSSNKRTLTGCVATSMSQVMNYHQHPKVISGDIPAYTTAKSGISVSKIPRANFNYNFSNMANADVANLNYHAGAAIKMNYGINESGAYSNDIVRVLPQFFDYDKGVRYIRKKGSYLRPEQYRDIGSDEFVLYSDSILPKIWDDIMRIQIDSLRPVIYGGNGTNGTGGHAFILEGYNDEGKFYFNWGWGGTHDGWFATSLLKPDTYDFSSNQDAVINIMPNLHGTGNYDFRIFGKNLIPSKTTLSNGENFNIDATIYNIGTATSSKGTTLGVILMKNDVEIEIIGTVELDSIMPFTKARTPQNYYSPEDYTLNISAKIPATLLSGTYTIKLAVMNNGEIESLIGKVRDYKDYAEITIHSTNIPVEIPIAIQGLVYNGTEQIGVAEGANYSISGNNATNAGTHFATANLINSGLDKFIWSDGTIGNKTIEWNIAKASGIFTPASTISATYAPTLKLSDLTLPTGYFWKNSATTINAGNGQTFPAIYSHPSGNYENATGEITVNVKKATIEIPTGILGLRYNGQMQSGVQQGNYSLMGNLETEIGEYTAIAILNDKNNYAWSDGTIEDKSIEWSIVLGPTIVEIPIAIQGLVYNGTEQIGVPFSDNYNITDNVGVRGLYRAIATLINTDSYEWSDGTRESKQIYYLINEIPSFSALEGKIFKPHISIKGGFVHFEGLPNDTKFSIYNLKGKMQSVPLSNAGIYFIRLNSSGEKIKVVFSK